MFSDFFETVFNLDNRLFRTLRDLFIPGELTNKYLAGKQRPFFQPLRLFFVSTVLMLSAHAILAVEKVGDKFNASIENARAGAYERAFASELSAKLDTIAMEYPGASNLALLDTIKARNPTTSSDSIRIGILNVKAYNDIQGEELAVAAVDFYTLSPQEIIALYEVTDWQSQYLVRQFYALMHSDSRAITNIMGQLIWGVIFLIPMSALMLKLIYIRRKRTYVEHLVFSLHVHALIFLLQALAAIVFYWFDTSVLLWATLPLTIVYFIGAQKRVYRQGWIKTLIKAWLLFIGYSVILSMAFGIGILASFLLF